MTMPSGLVALDEDHHVHSTFSDDAVSTVADNVRAARDRGLRVSAWPTTCARALLGAGLQLKERGERS